MSLWDDGRSGAAGCRAGNIVLESLARAEGIIRKVKGTVFEAKDSVFIGRICSSDEYLTEPVLHWANVSWDQHCDMEQLARGSGKSLFYLFITASDQPPAVRFWKVPARVIEEYLAGRGKATRNATSAIHIVASGGRHLIGKADVTGHHAELALDEADAKRLADAFRKSAPTTTQKAADSSQSTATGRAENFPAPVRRPASYTIPISSGRSLTLQIPGPLSEDDVSRLRSWIDLTADVLTEGYVASRQAAERQWLRAQVNEGLAELARGESVDGEEAFARVLSGGRRRRSEPAAP